MNTKARYVLLLTLTLFIGSALWVTLTWAAPSYAPQASGAPPVVAYQGEVSVSGVPYTGNGYFKFAVVNAAGSTTFWSNDGTSSGGTEPTMRLHYPSAEASSVCCWGIPPWAG